MLLQLTPSIPVETPRGRGEAMILIDYGPEFDLMWTVFLDSNGQSWTFKNSEIRACKNETLGRTLDHDQVAMPKVQNCLNSHV